VGEVIFQDPVIVRIVEPDPTGLGDVLIGALGLSGALFLASAVAAVAFGAALYWFRSRQRE
jgi:hypothetical protein